MPPGLFIIRWPWLCPQTPLGTLQCSPKPLIWRGVEHPLQRILSLLAFRTLLFGPWQSRGPHNAVDGLAPMASTLQNKDHRSRAAAISGKIVRGNRQKLARIAAYHWSSYVSDWCSQRAHHRRRCQEAVSETGQGGWNPTAGECPRTSAEFLYVNTTTFIRHTEITKCTAEYTRTKAYC